MKAKSFSVLLMLAALLVAAQAGYAIDCECSGNPPPVARLSANPSTVINRCGFVILDAGASYDSDGGNITQYCFDWTNNGSYDYCTSSDQGWRIYDTPGTYTAKVRVRDDRDCGYYAYDTETTTITVKKLIYVDADETSSGNGRCWNNAYKDLQDALSEATSGYEIWVAEGTYRPSTSDESISFTMVEGVEIYGGFDGGETARSQRDWEQNTTTLSGGSYSYHVVVGADDAVLDGFTITAGGERDDSGQGGGMYNVDCSPTVTNCTFSNNYTGDSGGVYNYNSSPTITNCIFYNNTAGMECGDGGGMGNFYSSPTIIDCVFDFNGAGGSCGGIENVYSSPLIVNCVFTRNEPYLDGGAMCNRNSSPTLINCTFARNRADPYGYGMYNTNNSDPTLINCILWDSSTNEITNDATSDPNISYSNIRGSGGSSSWDSDFGIDGGGNIDQDPDFVSTSDLDGPDNTWMTWDDGLRLDPNSPCIDAADGDVAPVTDIFCRGRIDIVDINNTGTGNPNWVDMGAYEFSYVGGYTKNIMLTGFWPPSNEMMRKFSTNPSQNPGGWQGENWEGRGYDVYSYFPEFPGGVGSNPKGNGDFEVDYQDVGSWYPPNEPTGDFWRITADIHPVAILSYGIGWNWWELEYNARNLSTWSGDYLEPYSPTPSPPDSSVSAGYVRNSSLPMQAIADAVNNAGIGVNSLVDWCYDPGAFLCGYMAYHDAWYKSLHSDPCDQYYCLAAGFTHVPGSLSVSTATTACEIALRTTIDYLDSQLIFYTVSGTITSGGQPLAGVAVNRLPGNPVTDASGFYCGQVGAGWSGTITPVKEGHVFSPVERTYSNVRANQSSQNYTGSTVTAETIEFDAASSNSSSTTSDTLSWSHTIGSGSNRTIVVAVFSEDNNADDRVISSVKYDGVNMTKVPATCVTLNYDTAELYYMLEADLPSSSGTYTVLVTYNGSVSDRTGGAISLKNVKQQVPEAVATNSSGCSEANSISTEINTLSSGAWIVDVVGHSDDDGSFSTSTSTERWEENTGVITGAGSTTVAESAGSNTISWNFSGGNGSMLHSLAAFAPAQE